MNKTDAHLRLLQAIEYLKDKGRARNHEEMADLTGDSRPNVTSAINGNPRYVTAGFLNRFGTAYSEYINKDWLLTGEGEMAIPDKSLRPHIAINATAGFMAGIGENDKGDDVRPQIPFISDYDFTITATGQSMAPEIGDGDILACRIVEDRANPPIGKICVIDSKEGAAVKVLKEASDESLLLHSLNPDYKDYKISVPELNRIAIVVGLIKKLA